MKLVTYERGGEERLGALSGELIVDLHRASRELSGGAAAVEISSRIVAFLEAGESAMAAARQALARVGGEAADPAGRESLMKGEMLIPRDSVKLRAPVPRPPKVIAAWVNYGEHGKEARIEAPDQAPLFFTIWPTAVIGPGDPIVLPRISRDVDFEAELALVIGRRGKDVPAAEAYDYVAGYTCLNDVSARDYSLKRMIDTVGPSDIQKSFDTFAPMGPCLVTTDEIEDPQRLAIKLSIDGEVMQDDNTSTMNHHIPRLIEYLSQITTLEPGDVITTGTPPGVGFVRTPPRYLQPGETVRIEIEKIGVLKNPVVAAEGRPPEWNDFEKKGPPTN